MSCLPMHGPIDCTRCLSSPERVKFGITTEEAQDGSWRIISNPLAWGSVEPKILVLGFSKGPTQVKAINDAMQDAAAFDQIAFKGKRREVGMILAHIGAVREPHDGDFKGMVDRIIADKNSGFHFGSLVRCAVERYNYEKGGWTGRHGNLADLTKTDFGLKVAKKCTSRFLGTLPEKTKLVVLFGNSPAYVKAVRKLVEKARDVKCRMVNEVAYTDESFTFVHVVHFSVRFNLVPNWLGAKEGTSKKKGLMAREAAMEALAC